VIELRLETVPQSGLRLLMDMQARHPEPHGDGAFRGLPIVPIDRPATRQLVAAQELIEASLVGSGPVPLLVDDYVQVFGGAVGPLTVEIQPLGWSFRSALPYKRLVAVVFAKDDLAYDEYLAVALGLQARLPERALFKVGLIHRPFQRPMLLLLGQL